MKTTKENLYLLYATPYKESDLIASFLSPTEGKLTARIYAGRKIGKKNSFFYHPGDLLTVEYQRRENDEFVKVLNISAVTLIGVDQRPYDQFIFHSYLLELIGRISKLGNPAQELYQLIEVNNEIDWICPKKLPFILWSLWSITYRGGLALDYHSCASCDRSTWILNAKGEVSLRKESYQLAQYSGRLLCSQCQQPRSSSPSITSAMIKIFWLLEHHPNFYTEHLNIPPALLVNSIHHLNQYLLHSYSIKPNSLEMFLKSLESQTCLPGR